MGLPPSKYPPKNQKSGFRLIIGVGKQKYGFSKKIKSGLNGLGSNSIGLVLWENDATRLRIIFKLDFWPPEAKKRPKVCMSSPRY